MLSMNPGRGIFTTLIAEADDRYHETADSEQWNNQHICQPYEVYHSQSQLCFRIEFSGMKNLHRCLSHSRRTGGKCRLLSIAKAVTLLE